MNKKELESRILIESKAIESLESQKRFTINHIVSNKDRIELLKILNNKIKERSETISDLLTEYRSMV